MTTKQIIYENDKYSRGTAYLCRFFGLHYLYFGRFGLWLLYAVTLGGLGLRCLVDAFRIPGMVEKKNLELMMKYGLIED